MYVCLLAQSRCGFIWSEGFRSDFLCSSWGNVGQAWCMFEEHLPQNKTLHKTWPDSQLLSCFFVFFFPWAVCQELTGNSYRTRPRSWDLMRREDSSVIALNPDAGDAFQVIRPWTLRLMLMEGRVCLERPWGSLLSWIAYIGARGYLEKSSIIWAAVAGGQLVTERSAHETERESHGTVY